MNTGGVAIRTVDSANAVSGVAETDAWEAKSFDTLDVARAAIGRGSVTTPVSVKGHVRG